MRRDAAILACASVMPWSSRTPSPIPWFSMLSMWSVRGRGDAGCPYAGALPTLPLGARGSGGTEVLARVCGPAGTGVLARVCGCTARSLGARGPWHVCAALEACAGEHWQIVVSHCPARGSWLVSLALQPGDGEKSANFFSRTVLRSTRKTSLDRFPVRHFSVSSVLRSSSKDSSPVLSAAPGVVAVSLPRPPSSSSSSSPPLLRSTRPGVPGPSLVTPGP